MLITILLTYLGIGAVVGLGISAIGHTFDPVAILVNLIVWPVTLFWFVAWFLVLSRIAKLLEVNNARESNRTYS